MRIIAKHIARSFNYVEWVTHLKIKSTMQCFLNNIVFWALTNPLFPLKTSPVPVELYFFEENIGRLEANNRHIKTL